MGKHYPHPASLVVEGQPEWKIQALIGHKKRKKRGKKIVTHYLVRWEGYGPNYDSWEPVENVKDCTDLIKTYWGMQKSGAKGRELTPPALPEISLN